MLGGYAHDEASTYRSRDSPSEHRTLQWLVVELAPAVRDVMRHVQATTESFSGVLPVHRTGPSPWLAPHGLHGRPRFDARGRDGQGS